jgi:hypothetical protein
MKLEKRMVPLQMWEVSGFAGLHVVWLWHFKRNTTIRPKGTKASWIGKRARPPLLPPPSRGRIVYIPILYNNRPFLRQLQVDIVSS